MVTLALDSTTPAGSLAVGRNGRVVLARRGDPSRPHGERLPGDVLALLANLGLTLGDVTLYAVATGPGAFTGLRIGIAAIQGLAFAESRPVVGISALDALAHGAAGAAAWPVGTRVGVWMDAARLEVFAALYEVDMAADTPEGLRMRPLDEPSVGPPHVVLARWAAFLEGRSAWLVGDGATRYRETAIGAHPALGVLDAWPPVAAAMIPLAGEAAAQGQASRPHAIRPLYVRRPDAEIARDRRDIDHARPQ